MFWVSVVFCALNVACCVWNCCAGDPLVAVLNGVVAGTLAVQIAQMGDWQCGE